MRESIFVGFDPREAAAFLVTVSSIRRHLSRRISIVGLELDDLRRSGLYTRPTIFNNGRLLDTISEHPMSTEFAISRFLVPTLAGKGWALFLDCDMLVLSDLADLFDLADDSYAVMCVKHNHDPNNTTKMGGQLQSTYFRKNWSSVCLFNCDHPANKSLTTHLVNSARGLHLHQFCWLEDKDIGALPSEYNFLVGTDTPTDIPPKIAHYTEGTPDLPGYETAPYADLWRSELRKSAHLFL